VTDISGRSAEIAAVARWFDLAERDLPWRRDRSPWGVLVSEVMLQQTPVARVEPVFEQWMARWPTPVDLAGDSPGAAVRMWGRLGYPRRALRLHAAATMCTDEFDGRIPDDVADLRRLPGVGDYTAAAVAAFAFGQRQAVLDTNVRRVHARWLDGVEFPRSTTVSAPERQRALDLLPLDSVSAARVSVAVMELGALICTARTPKCTQCPIAEDCSWHRAGHPAWDGPPRRAQTWHGTDRQCRGQIMALIRDTDETVTSSAIANVWPDAEQRERAAASLVSDGLIVSSGEGYRLPERI
jgi:A/G-specific adenine glycosylase